MKEYKVGEQIVLEVKEQNGCEGCFFCYNRTCIIPIGSEQREGLLCGVFARSDGKNVIFVEKGK